jgi:hypothetical protein
MTIRRLSIGLALLVVSLFLFGSHFLRSSVAAAAEANKCGCYADSAGSCYCNKNAKCGCPGECEPKNCDAQRQKQFDREIQAETRRAAAAGRKSSEVAVPKDSDREKSAARGMTGSQKRELSRLLSLYLAERPNDRGKTLGDLLGDLSHAEKSAARPDQ